MHTASLTHPTDNQGQIHICTQGVSALHSELERVLILNPAQHEEISVTSGFVRAGRNRDVYTVNVVTPALLADAFVCVYVCLYVCICVVLFVWLLVRVGVCICFCMYVTCVLSPSTYYIWVPPRVCARMYTEKPTYIHTCMHTYRLTYTHNSPQRTLHLVTAGILIVIVYKYIHIHTHIQTNLHS
jgi:hypothetical protein